MIRWPTPSRSRSRPWSCPTPTSRESTPTRSSTSPPPTSSATWGRQTEHRTPTFTRSPPRPARLINFQLMSVVLTRSLAPAGTAPNDYNQGPFDTYLVIYDSSGQVIAYNDDSFQDSDSSIIDLTLPTTGTYYAMVTSSPKSVSLGEPLTGDYELFMYTFATGARPTRLATRCTPARATTRSSPARPTTRSRPTSPRTRSSTARAP